MVDILFYWIINFMEKSGTIKSKKDIKRKLEEKILDGMV